FLKKTDLKKTRIDWKKGPAARCGLRHPDLRTKRGELQRLIQVAQGTQAHPVSTRFLDPPKPLCNTPRQMIKKPWKLQFFRFLERGFGVDNTTVVNSKHS